MDRDRLEAYLSEGLSLPQIGKLTGRDPSTVGYWVAKFGLVANGKQKYAPRGGLTREQLEPFVERGATLQEMADQLGRCTSTVRHWLLKFDLKTGNGRGPRPSVDRSAELEEALSTGQRTIVARCHRHGVTEFAVIAAQRRLRCKQCRSEAVARRRRRVKEILVREAGGKCVLCGYDRCLAALEFHHLDPEVKSFGVAQRGITRAIEQVREEARKCALLCANCHAEIEVGYASLPVEFSSAIVPD
jgi:transposase